MAGPGAAGRARASAGGKLHGAGRARSRAAELSWPDGGGLCGRGDEDRHVGGRGCELSGILPGDAWGTGSLKDSFSRDRCP